MEKVPSVLQGCLLLMVVDYRAESNIKGKEINNIP